MTSVNVPERMNELSAGVTHVTTEGRRGEYRKSRLKSKKRKPWLFA
jgi:hypothetical protein